MRRKSLYYAVIFLCFLALPLGSCGPTFKMSKAERETYRRQQARVKEGERTYRAAQRRHESVQSRDTRRQMRETRRKSQGFMNNNKRPPFYVRWYNAVRRR